MKKTEKKEMPEMKPQEAKEKPAKKIATTWQRVKSKVRRFIRKHFMAIQITEAAIVFTAVCALLFARRGK